MDAIWSGIMEAGKHSDRFGSPEVWVSSTDKEAFAVYCAEVDELTPKSADDE
ncbi:hypothetical protein [Paenibacillus soyae]|uniref:Uncharacterized protein n=1 Tax=Paenibacillus soyae TaxID=2969249 RepID=A0A9X2MR63_9BACL|nr:hypothetical protein [Paenibacillus soyae]MCR2805329.1 hypothetical protein [Paenibacillus soyae]